MMTAFARRLTGQITCFVARLHMRHKTGWPDKHRAIWQHDSEIRGRFKRHTAAENRVGDGQHFRMQL